MQRSRIAWLATAFFLGGCGTMSPPPGDHFYRLDMPVPTLVEGAGDRASITFLPAFSASGLHSERALVHAHSDGTSLEQYSYHFWIDSPRRMLQLALAEYLKVSLGMTVLEQPARAAEQEIRGHIVQFERRNVGAGDAAFVVINFEVFRRQGRVPVFARRYERQIDLKEKSIAATAAALNVGTVEIFSVFVHDLGQLH